MSFDTDTESAASRGASQTSPAPPYAANTSDTEPRAEFTAFDQSTKQDWELIAGRLPATQSMAAANIVEQLRMLERDHGGFPVSRLEHSLPTASRAENDGREEEYVLCALLHDIGDTLAPYDHPSIAAGIVKPFVSEANHWMVEHHGIFQGYDFWHHLGMDRDTRDRSAHSPYYERTEEYCAKYDQTTFDPDYVSAPLSHDEPSIATYFDPTVG